MAPSTRFSSPSRISPPRIYSLATKLTERFMAKIVVTRGHDEIYVFKNTVFVHLVMMDQRSLGALQ